MLLLTAAIPVDAGVEIIVDDDVPAAVTDAEQILAYLCAKNKFCKYFLQFLKFICKQNWFK